jgi:uncharacterized protein (TIGR00299 family) protein
MTCWLHFDSVGGASGDMILAALIDLGVAPAALNDALAGLGAGPIRIEAERVEERGLQGTRVTVRVPAEAHPHPRHLDAITRLIRGSSLPERVRTLSLRVFERLAEAEATIHHTTPDRIHFHELGALDSLADVVASCLALDLAGAAEVSVGPLPLGHGTVTCAHGVLPVPAPATVELLRGLQAAPSDEPFELVTPTGAALLSTWRTREAPPDGARLEAAGYGVGHRRLERRPNLLRALRFSAPTTDGAAAELCLELQTNVDDASPEWIGALLPRLLAAGARDAFITPVQMKKQRPGVLLTVLCAPEQRAALLNVLFTESTTFGVREHLTRRTVLERRVVEAATPYGAVRVKIGRWQGRDVTRAPEYDDCLRVAEAHGVPVRAVYDAALAALAGRSDV